MTRKKVISIVSQNSDRKSVPVKGTRNARRSRGFAPVAMALYNQYR